MDDFPMLVELFKPLMHTLLMVWKHSKNYNTASRLVILMRMISTDLIARACRFVQGEEIFQINCVTQVRKGEDGDLLRTVLSPLDMLATMAASWRAGARAARRGRLLPCVDFLAFAPVH